MKHVIQLSSPELLDLCVTQGPTYPERDDDRECGDENKGERTESPLVQGS